MSVTWVAKLSDYAATISRSREAKAVIVLVLESDGSVYKGTFIEQAKRSEIQDMLCAAIVDNALSSKSETE